LLLELGFSRHVNRKTKEGGDHPDRDEQFEYINGQVNAFQAAGQPVISVDTKKKELVGAYKNGGSDYRAEGCPSQVKVHDFIDKSLAGRFLTESAISQLTLAGSASASTTARQNSQSTPSAAGMKQWDKPVTQTQTV